MSLAVLQRHYLMCRPTHFAVDYAINPWMDPRVPVDRDLAVGQWESLRQTYLSLGHRVDLISPVPGLPDMVFAANGALVVDGAALGARFRDRQRAPEAAAYLAWLEHHGYRCSEPEFVSEGEGDFLVTSRFVLAGTEFRTERRAHLEAQEKLGRPVLSLQLVDPRYYHLDTALCVLGDDDIAYYPGAFSAASRSVLQQVFPDAVIASARDASVLGLNAVSDGLHVVIPDEAAELAVSLKERGYEPVPVDLSELLKAGGGPKCCTLELRP